MSLNPSNPETIRAWQRNSKPLGRSKPLERGTELRRTGLALIQGGSDGAAVLPFPQRKPRKRAGFPDAVKLAVRKRAGAGDPDDARCEACGIWLGRYGGQVQHRDARGIGGTSLPVTNSIVNAALLCGTPFTGCHGLAEKRDPRMNAEGFWLRDGEDPAETPIALHVSRLSGMTVWLGPDGTYKHEPPGGSAA